MKKTQLYLLAILIAFVGVSAILYKWKVLNFPIQPSTEVEVWSVQARVEYTPRRAANKVTLVLPTAPPGFTILDERYIARGYSLLEESRRGEREAQWTIRRANGKQVLYYRATVVRGPASDDPFRDAAKLGQTPELEEPHATAAQILLGQVREGSADIVTFAQELVRRFNDENPSQEVALLSESFRDSASRTQFFVQLLSIRHIPARVVYGFQLGETHRDEPMLPWLQVHNGVRWATIDPRTAAEGWPQDLFLWTRSGPDVLTVEETQNASVTYSVTRNLADAMAIAERRLEVQNADLVNYSLLSLPLQAQEVYRVLLMVPIGAFIMLLLRNLVGIKTYGTFMPVLIALAFRETQLLAGIVLFAVVIGAGLLVRFYMERLRLLLVPRLTAVLILVVLLMAAVSVLSNRLGIEVGLSVALFPMVILAMTIERISVTWEERGAGPAIREAIGTLAVAALAYLVMSWNPLEHFVFVFPEILLVLFALTLVLGRYSGYRLSELFRFRNLARESEKQATVVSSDVKAG
ncbi:inactive transglutaminase family protein [Xanthomonadaceae bacterium JHOS43]|nr:inactive transglutaminase family protein [Xanthomonadaceae bacterium JHOS43]